MADPYRLLAGKRENFIAIMNKIILFFAGLLVFPSVYAQNLKGQVTDLSGNPVDGAYLYITETKQGLVCNEQGTFQSTLPAGEYLLQLQCLGYESQSKKVVIPPKETVVISFRLLPKTFTLPEVVVRQGEDPAYEIMRQAIRKAPYYRSYIKESHYETYVKGSGKLLKMPKLAGTLSGINFDLYKDKLFLQESFSDIKFTAPDQYIQTVKAFSSTIPEDVDPKESIGIATSSLYEEKFAGFISPLHPKAFSYYRFRYEGFTEENGQVINKIKIIPKLNDPNFLQGYIYIADKEWNIRRADLNAHTYAGDIDHQLIYNPVMEGVYLVTSYSTHLSADLLGMKLNFNYETSMKYLDIQLNDSLPAAGKETAYLIPATPPKKKSLEIKGRENFTIYSDSTATKRDSAYWAGIRKTVLNEEEILSYEIKDSIAEIHKKERKKEYDRRYRFSDIFLGGRAGGDSTRYYFQNDGLLFGVPEYNFVDGFWMGQGLEFGFRPREHYLLTFKPYVYWTTARERLVWNTEIAYQYAPMSNGRISVSGGSVSTDYSGNNGIAPILNSLYSLLAGKNKAAFYQKDYLRAENEIDLANGLQLNTSVTLAKRKILKNHTSYSLWGSKNDIRPNLPDFEEPLNEQFDNLYQYAIQLSYTPEYYYRVYKGKKQYAHSSYPTFTLRYQQGLDMGHESSAFKQMELTIQKNYSLGLFDRLIFRMNGGIFIDSKEFNYMDYKHFNLSNQLFTDKGFETGYTLLDPYRYATDDKWAQVFVTYQSDYLALKRLPFLQGKLFNEALHLNFLSTPAKKAYGEFGYSLGLSGLGRIGAFVSLDRQGYDRFGIRISLPLLRSIGINRK